AEPRLDGAYWTRNLRAPVRFDLALERLAADGHTLFLELSPHPTLSPSITESLRHLARPGTVVTSLRRDQPETDALLSALAALYTLGCAVDWRGLYPSGGRFVRLPAYPWQRRRYWLPTEAPGVCPPGRPAQAGDQALLGRRVALSTPPEVRLWETELSVSAFPYLADHLVQGETVLPAAAYLALAASAARESFGDNQVVLEQISFRRILLVPVEPVLTLQVALTLAAPDTATFQISSRASGTEAWTLHAEGFLNHRASPAPLPAESPAAVQARCGDNVTGAELYSALEAQGLHYGERFRGVEHLWRGAGEALGCIHAPAALSPAAPGDVIHPALLDACLQVMAAASPRAARAAAADDTYLPVGVAQVWLPRPAAGRLWSHARYAADQAAGSELVADLDVLDESGQLVGRLRGLRLQRVDSARQAPASLAAWLHELRWAAAAAPLPPVAPAPPRTWLILGGPNGPTGELAAGLRASGDQVVSVTRGPVYQALSADEYTLDAARPAAFGQLLKDIFTLSASGARRPPVGGLVYLWSLEPSPADERRGPAAAAELSCLEVVHLVQALAHTGWRDAPRLWLVTRGVQRVMPSDQVLGLAHSPLWGLGRTLAYEHPELDCTLIDLAAEAESGDAQALLRELRSADREQAVALRSGVRRVARLVRWTPATALAAAPADFAPAGERPFRLETRQPGALDALTLRAAERLTPGPGQVEIAVEAAGLNFLDVLLALGALPDDASGADDAGPRLGSECAGRVVALGAGVDDLTLGQAVVAVASRSLARFVTTPRHLVTPRPARLTAEIAAGLPLAFLTADYALRHIARLAPGERVLIHAAAGGVGLAAVQIAQQIGAEVFATAGSPAKRDLLRSLGVAHLADSRSLAFVDDFRRATAGAGVDVVLNSLAGPFIAAGLELLRPYGRFVELGKRDYYAGHSLPARPFLRSLSFALVDLRGLASERPAFFQALLQDLLRRFERGELRPTSTTVVPIGEAAAAFRALAQAQPIGKLVVSLQAAAQTPIAPAIGATQIQVQSSGAYLLTGGLGGLGLKLAEWLVARGARRLALLGRSAPSDAAAQ
ncbi:MAG: polyketide synthase dehydratase domain-containing protein, partial [Anaerolineales bacterium]|nr:polyketide synthase dehydratase domain-containing protein [Anaerolineales bacterium]